MLGVYTFLYCKPHWLYNERSPPRIGCAVFPYSLYLSTWYQEKATIGLPLPLPPCARVSPLAPHLSALGRHLLAPPFLPLLRP